MDIQKLKKLQVTPNSVIKNEEVFLKYKGAVLLSANNMSTITGPPKAFKTTFKDLVCEKTLNNDDNFTGDFNGKILIIDTEQSSSQVQKSAKRIERVLGDKSDNVLLFAVKSLSINKRIQAIETLIKEYRPKIVIIDGTRDLISDINSQEQSMYLVNKIMLWVSKYNLHIINILHTNPHSETVRGAIGTELCNKSETVMHTSLKGNEMAYVKPLFSRDISFESFNIFLEKGVPVYREVKSKKR